MQIQKDNKWNIAFQTWYGQYEYQVILFGLYNALAIF